MNYNEYVIKNSINYGVVIILDNEFEIWKPLILPEPYTNFIKYGQYFISNYGRIYGSYRKKIIKPQNGNYCNNFHQYWKRVEISLNDKTSKKFLVHRLVAFNFIDNPDDKPQVNHIDGNPENNFYKNLEWVSGSENMIHAYKNNLVTVHLGEDRSNSIFTNNDVKQVCELMEKGLKAKKNLFIYN